MPYTCFRFNQAVVFGSRPGLWVFPYVKDVSAGSFLMCLLAVPAVCALIHITTGMINRSERAVVFFWFFAGVLFQIAVLSIRPFSLGEIVSDPVANSFYTAVSRYRFTELFANYIELAKDRLPMHVKTNMPGKLLLYYLLRLLTRSPEMMGHIIGVISASGSILTYYLTKRLFRDRRISAYAMIFYLFIPARIIFLPLLNSITPVFLLTTSLLFFQCVDRKNILSFCLLGISLFLLFLFEPTPLITGLIFLSFLAKYLLENSIDLKDTARMIFWTVLSAALMSVLTFLALKINVLSAFRTVIDSNMELYLMTGREYGIWAVENIRNFFINGGVLQSLIFIVFLLLLISDPDADLPIPDGKRSPPDGRNSLLSPIRILTFSFIGTLLLLDLLGTTRGEVERTWIFMMVFLQIIAAYFCVTRLRMSTFYIMVSALIVQIILSLEMVGFVQPFSLP